MVDTNIIHNSMFFYRFYVIGKPDILVEKVSGVTSAVVEVKSSKDVKYAKKNRRSMNVTRQRYTDTLLVLIMDS